MTDGLSLDVELTKHQLGLRPHGDVLPRGHGEGTGDQTGDAGQADGSYRGMGAGHAEDEGDVGDQAVADAEDRGAGSSPLQVPVTMVGGHIGQRTDRHSEEALNFRPRTASVAGPGWSSGPDSHTVCSMVTTVQGIEKFHGLVGKHLGYSDWHRIDQDQINLFAEATNDHQWIHVDPERAKGGPFGSTIAHGYLTLSLAPGLLGEVLVVEGMSMGVNYGCNKVRFPAPVPVDSNLRLGVAVAEVEDVTGGVQVALDLTFETEGSSKPSCVAQVVYRYFY